LILLYFHCGQRLDIPFKEIIERAESVKLTRSETRWHDWERFSGRQKRQIETTDKQIDQLVYKLYNLTEEEIKIVESEIRW